MDNSSCKQAQASTNSLASLWKQKKHENTCKHCTTDDMTAYTAGHSNHTKCLCWPHAMKLHLNATPESNFHNANSHDLEKKKKKKDFFYFLLAIDRSLQGILAAPSNNHKKKKLCIVNMYTAKCLKCLKNTTLSEKYELVHLSMVGSYR